MRILAFDIGGTLIKSAIVDEDKGLFNLEEHSYPEPGRDGILNILENRIDYYNSEIDGIGISTAGLVDEEKGVIILSSNGIPNYTGTKLKEMYELKYNKPVWVLNDVNAAALGEAHFGAGKDYNDFICLTYGTGVGGAIVINKQVYGGKNGFAGEIGHTVTHLNGKKCVCGLYGCYNDYASTKTLVENCSQVDFSIKNGKDVFNAFSKGDLKIKEQINIWIDEIIYGLVTVVHIFNPPAIILGGGIMRQEYIIDEINNRLKNSILSGYRDVVVLPAMLGNSAGLMGASYNTLRRKCEIK